MTPEEKLFDLISENLKDSERSQMFGKACFKINKKAIISFYDQEMVFNLSGINREEALALEGAKLFDPSAKNRPMKEWVQIPFFHSNVWSKFGQMSLDYVLSIS